MKNTLSKSYNYGFAVLKMWMCFEVVLCHFWHQENYSVFLHPFRTLTLTAVPVFALISFCLTAPSFFSVNCGVFRKRMVRLCLPQIVWSIIYWTVYAAAGIVSGCDEFLWQLFTGHSDALNATMWYQVVIILITVLFFAIGYPSKGKKTLAATTAIGIAALIFQYSGLNHLLFSGLRYELRYPLGRFWEMLPFASLGLILADKNIPERLKKHPLCTIVCACAMLALSFTGIIPTPGGFDYSGLNPILRAFGIISVACIIPFEKTPAIIQKIIRLITRYTLGIYCMHRLVEKLLGISGITAWLQNFNIAGNSFAFCIIIYVISYMISASIAAIPVKLCRQLVE